MSDVTNEIELDMMRHALGWRDGAPPKEPFRNWYCAGVGSDAADVWESMVEKGLAVRGTFINDGRDRYYKVTLFGQDCCARLRNGRFPWRALDSYRPDDGHDCALLGKSPAGQPCHGQVCECAGLAEGEYRCFGHNDGPKYSTTLDIRDVEQARIMGCWGGEAV